MDARHAVAIAAARAAASLIRAGFTRLGHIDVEQKTPGDVVTALDRAAEAEIRRLIWAAFPGDAILGEEGGAQAGPATASGWRWIVDPLDGTYNFVHGNPHVCTSIACLNPDGEIEIAVIKDPMRVEIFHARRGAGAFNGDVRLQVNHREVLGDALVAMVVPSAQNAAFTSVWPKFEAVTRAVGQIRRTGSAALDMAYVAAGRLDGFVVMSLRSWDIAAGALLVREAGGAVCDLQGGDAYMQREQIIASNAHLVPDLVRVLQSAA